MRETRKSQRCSSRGWLRLVSEDLVDGGNKTWI